MGVGTGKERVAVGAGLFMAVGMFPVELLAYQVSMACVADWLA